jgi:hypothetical protein
MAEVARLPAQPAQSIADQLRALAERIESGEYGEVHSVTWVADIGGMVEVGHCGNAPFPEAGPVSHLILAMGMRKLELG